MDLADVTGLTVFLLISVGLPAVGYWLMVLDVRRYWRALRRALVVAAHFATGRPEWAARQIPPALHALGLSDDCTEDEVREAYRQLAERCHPDRGGSRVAFHRLRRHYEEALLYVRQQAVANDGYSSVNSSRYV